MSSVPGATPTTSALLDPTEQRHRRNRLILCGLAVLVSAAGIGTSVGEAVTADIAAICRVALGIIGLAAGALLWFRPALGWRIGAGWALAQIPFYAWSPSGSPTEQWPSFLLGFTTESKINGVTTSYSAIGFNAVGILLFVIFQRWRSSADRQAV